MDNNTKLYNRLRVYVMKRIFIVGGNGFARECFKYIMAIKEVEFGGFLGHGGYGHTVNYLDLQEYYKGEVSKYNFQKEDYVIIGAGYPNLRKKIYDDLKKMNLKFYTLLSPNSKIDSDINIGEGNIIVGSKITSHNIKIGNGNLFNGNVTIGHDVEVGNFNFFGPSSQLLGNVKVGNHNIVGANSILLPSAKIRNNNKIAPLSTIYKGCKNNCYMLGNPAIKVGEC